MGCSRSNIVLNQNSAILVPSSPRSSRAARANPFGLPPGLPEMPFGNGRLIGTDGPDVLHGSFSQVVVGLAGNDTLYADDTYYFFDGNTLYGGPGDDKLVGGYAQDIVYGGPGDDTFSGGASKDILIGGRGQDASPVGEAAT